MEEWEYSSFADYCGKRNGTLCNRELAVKLLGLNMKTFYEDSYKTAGINDMNDLFNPLVVVHPTYRCHAFEPWHRYAATNMKLRINKLDITRFLKRLGIATIGLFLLFLLLNIIFPLRDKVEYSTIITDKNGEVINAFLTKDEK